MKYMIKEINIMKKICFILPTLGNGGAERVAFHLLNNLDSQKYQLYLVLTNKGGNYLEELNPKVKLIELNKSRARYASFKLYKTLRNINPDLCLVFSSEIATVTGLFVAPFLKDVKFIVREINIQSMLMTNILRKILLKYSYKSMYKIISQSKDMTNDLINFTKIDPRKIVEINNPIDIKQIEKKINHIQEEDIFDKRYKNLVCVGRLVHQKGFDLLVKVMEKLKSKNIRLYIIGEGKERQKLENMISYYNLTNNVFLVGRQENPYKYMRECDLFILSSRFEGFPNVLIEAGACGAYAICNTCPGGVNEIILENINGNIVNFVDVLKTKNVILEQLSKVHNKGIIRKSVVDRYSLGVIIEKYENLFQY